jgi:hypothetical protein
MSFKKKILSIACIFLISGCMSIADPIILSEKKEQQITARPLKNVLVVIDISVEYPHLPSGLAFSKQDNMTKMYESLAKAMVTAVQKTGGNASYQLVFNGERLSIPSDVSHVWAQTLIRLTKTSSSQGYYISSRTWEGGIAQRSPSSSEFLRLFKTAYVSDGPSCFTISQYANRDECQKKYLDLVVRQLEKSGLQKAL